LNKNPFSQEELIQDVLEQDLCSACGACIGLCPYFSFFQGRVTVLDHCSLVNGRCKKFCPHLNPNPSLTHDHPGQILERGMTRSQLPASAKKGSTAQRSRL